MVDGQYEGALSAKGLVCLWTSTRVGMLCPRPPDAGGREHASFVRLPACTAGSNHPISAIVLEDGRRLVVSGRSHAGVAAGMVQVVGCQLGNVESQILLGGKDVVGLSVIVDVERHIARHLSILA